MGVAGYLRRPLVPVVTVLIATLLSCNPGGLLVAAEEQPEPTRWQLSVSTGEVDGSLTLHGGRDRRQLVVTAVTENGTPLEDLTHKVQYAITPATLARVEDGLVIPLTNGSGQVTITLPPQQQPVSGEPVPAVQVQLNIDRFGDDPAIDFVSQVVPIFTKHGCNGGGCHGKSGGQNSFRLSLLGFEPAEDHEHIVTEARGRRVSLTAPRQSLLLTKATAAIPHGGGKLLTDSTADYDLLLQWIEEGCQPSSSTPPTVTGIEVFPTERRLKPSGQQQLRVLARYSDGRVVDVTRLAQYEGNATELADVDKAGLVQVATTATDQRSGTVAIMVRFCSRVAVFRGVLPLDVPLAELPAADTFSRNLVDRHVLDHLRKLRLPPSPVCDDATFIRRITLDLAGRLPTPEETRQFLAASESTKRDALIERLLASPDYADHFAMKWSAILRNQRSDNELHRRGSYAFHAWIRQALQENRPYNEFVADILTASGEVATNPPVIWYRQVKDINQQVEDAAQLFLGQRLQCARCHHHPFEKWGTDDYFKLAAFFSQVSRKPGTQPGEDRIYHRRGTPQAKGPKAMHAPAVLDGATAAVASSDDPRTTLATWMAEPDNPFFARSLVNRYWKHFFAVGLVEPEDDLRITNPATNPALLDGLAAAFIDSGFDLKAVIRLICQSRTYQLASEPNAFNAEDRQSFSRYYARRLPAEVALDAVDRLTLDPTRFQGVPPGTRAVELPDPNFDNYFLTVFGRPKADSACECERGSAANLAQCLHLINSDQVLAKLKGKRAQSLADDTARTITEKIDELYLVAFSRSPRSEEQAAIEAFLAARSDTPETAWQDVLWTLLNTKEFLFNH